jgi:hypothetical protein
MPHFGSLTPLLLSEVRDWCGRPRKGEVEGGWEFELNWAERDQYGATLKSNDVLIIIWWMNRYVISSCVTRKF